MELEAGVNILWTSASVSSLITVGMGSPTGRCHTFDAQANGYARNEACVAAALQIDDHLEVISSISTQQDGRSASLTAPNGVAQKALLIATFKGAGVTRDRVSQFEAHGTGTALGDPIEVCQTRTTP